MCLPAARSGQQTDPAVSPFRAASAAESPQPSPHPVWAPASSACGGDIKARPVGPNLDNAGWQFLLQISCWGGWGFVGPASLSAWTCFLPLPFTSVNPNKYFAPQTTSASASRKFSLWQICSVTISPLLLLTSPGDVPGNGRPGVRMERSCHLCCCDSDALYQSLSPCSYLYTSTHTCLYLPIYIHTYVSISCHTYEHIYFYSYLYISDHMLYHYLSGKGKKMVPLLLL